jgi:hypothetical protein
VTLDQLAALLDQLKRPIEEAPKGPNKPAIWACRENDQWMVVFEVEHSEVYGWCGYNNTNYFVTGLTHFLPLPKPGPVEFEIVPKDQPAPFIQGCISCQGKGGWVTVAGFEVCNDCKGEGRR